MRLVSRFSAFFLISFLVLGNSCFLVMDAVAASVSVPRGATVLTGSASIKASSYRLYRPYATTIRRADRLVAQYALNAAESAYVGVLKNRPADPGALNGVGKVAYLRTTSSNQYYRNQEDSLIDFAISRFLLALQYQPGYVEARLNLASAYMSQGRMQEALRQIEIAKSISPASVQVSGKYGEWLSRNRQTDKALSVLDATIKKNPRSVSAHYYRAEVFSAVKNDNKALDDLNTVLWLKPDHAMAHALMADIYTRQSNLAAGVEHYQEALRLKPELEKARVDLAALYEKQGDWSEAVRHLKLLAASAKGNWRLTQKIGELQIKNHQPQLAIQEYQHWLSSHPEDTEKVSMLISDAKTMLASVHAASVSLVEQGVGYRHATQSLAFNPNNFSARLIRASLDRQSGHSILFEPHHSEQLDMLINTQASTPATAYEKGRALLKRFQFREATKWFELARRGATSQEEQLVIATLFLEEGMPLLAESCYEKILERSPQSIEAQLGVSSARKKVKQSMVLTVSATQADKNVLFDKRAKTASILQLQEAIALNLHNVHAHYRLAKEYEGLNYTAPALDHYYAVSELAPYDKMGQHAFKKVIALKAKLD